MANPKIPNPIAIYGVGGAGINIVAPYLNIADNDNSATIKPMLIDTSTSNVGHIKNSDSMYLVEGVDGSGKIRKENHLIIDRSISQALIELEPETFNVVVFSAAGGSGSVIGPLLIAELNKRKHPVVAIVVGEEHSLIAAENTMKTIQSLIAISNGTNVPVVMSYHKNEGPGGRGEVDEQIRAVIGCLGILFSGNNAEMDSRDLIHWLQYNLVNGDAATLATMHIAGNSEEFKRIAAPISVASLYHSTTMPQLAAASDYLTIGYADMANSGYDELHFVIATDDLVNISEEIMAAVDKMHTVREARIDKENPLKAGIAGNVTESNIVI